MFLKAVYHDIFDKNENYQRLILNHYYVYKKNAVFAFFFCRWKFYSSNVVIVNKYSYFNDQSA